MAASGEQRREIRSRKRGCALHPVARLQINSPRCEGSAIDFVHLMR